MAAKIDLSGNNPTDKPFDGFNRTNAGDPLGVTPEYPGERILDTANGVLYEALSNLNNSWVQVTP